MLRVFSLFFIFPFPKTKLILCFLFFIILFFRFFLSPQKNKGLKNFYISVVNILRIFFSLSRTFTTFSFLHLLSSPLYIFYFPPFLPLSPQLLSFLRQSTVLTAFFSSHLTFFPSYFSLTHTQSSFPHTFPHTYTHTHTLRSPHTVFPSRTSVFLQSYIFTSHSCYPSHAISFPTISSSHLFSSSLTRLSHTHT